MRFHRLIGFGSLLAVLLASAVRAELRPDEIAILTVRTKESGAVARYYAKVRNVPTSQILSINAPPREDLSREAWETQVRPAIRSWFETNQMADKIRCVVTVYDVPLRIKKAEADADLQQMIEFLREERATRIDRINDYLQVLSSISGQEGTSLGPTAELNDVKTALDQGLTAAQAVTANMDDAEKAQVLQKLQTIYLRSLGLTMLAQSLDRQIKSGASNNPELMTQFAGFRGRVMGLREGRTAMEGLPFSLERDPQVLAVIEISDGLFGTLNWIDDQIQVLTKNETYSSFDSELSLVLWDDYLSLRWQPNYLHYRFDNATIRRFKPTLMVSRIEAPSLRRTRDIIDEAIEVEKKGLSGKAYFDARGLAQLDDTGFPTGSYQDYDQAVLRAAELIKNHTDIEVVVDTGEELFQEGACPDAALYCGWYKLAQYVDAFEWNPGSVAYHMASSEASTLRKRDSQVWCKRMLEDGVSATLGPSFEPYISAFPRPDEFFALLLSGKFSLVESFYRSNPYNSWNMVLVGDPLYSPFKTAPALNTNELNLATRRIIDGPDALLSDEGT